jgi:serine/threonine protein phosphatase PrpC
MIEISDISSDGRFIVIASDGLWEFISNEEAVAMVEPFYNSGDADGASARLL